MVADLCRRRSLIKQLKMDRSRTHPGTPTMPIEFVLSRSGSNVDLMSRIGLDSGNVQIGLVEQGIVE